MPFWVHGTDTATGRPRDSLFIEAGDEADARQQATEAGMTVEEVEFVPPAPDEAPTSDVPAPGAPPPPADTRVQRLRCVRCNSSRVVPRATIWDSDHDIGGRPLQVYVDAKPHALLFRGTTYATLYARVCADCGHTELFADGAEELYRAYRQSRTEGTQ